MSHYTKNVQSLLTGGFKVLNVIFKNKFRVKDNTKELCFSDYIYRCFSQNVRVWGKRKKKKYCWWKWIQTVLEVMNLKPFSDTHFWTLFTHSCIALSTLFNVFPLTHKAKSSTNKKQSVPFTTALTMLLILIWKGPETGCYLAGAPSPARAARKEWNPL